MQQVIRVFLADDHPFVRAGIRATLADEPGVTVVGEAGDGRQVQQMCYELQPDVLLLDLSMPGPTPVETVKSLRNLCPSLRILVLTAFDDDAYFRSLKNAGVAGYVLKDEMPRTMVSALYGIMRGERWFVHPMPRSARSLSTAAPTEQATKSPAPLTNRELSVLRLVVTGKANHEIGNTLGISAKTVEKHLGEVFTKLAVTTRVEAAVWAVRSGIV